MNTKSSKKENAESKAALKSWDMLNMGAPHKYYKHYIIS